MKTVILKFSGPMQSWGTSSNYEIRKTDYYPSKSGVIGLVAAALGYDRENEEISHLNNLDFAVRIDQQGILKRDFQIAHDYNKDSSYIVNRYYMEDAVYLVALGGDETVINRIIKALKNPKYPLYMGRKSCPVPAEFILKTSDRSPKEVLLDEKWHASDWFKNKYINYIAEIYYDSNNLSDNCIIRNDKIVSLSKKGRLYEPRLESQTSIVVSNDNTATGEESSELNFFSSLEE